MAKEFKQTLQIWVKAYFGFSRTETNAFLILLPLLVLILFSEPAYRWWITSRPPDFSKDARALDSIVAHLQWDTDSLKVEPERTEAIFFPFNPNVSSQDEFVKLGLPLSMATRLVRYRAKGGMFRKKEDLLKIYGLDSAWFMHAKEWINIPDKPARPKPNRVVQKQLVTEMIDINMADSLQLLKVYGIGPALSKRIRTFRDRLGGLVSMNQLREVYGLDTVVVRQMRSKFFVAANFQPRKINLNTVTREGFKHPYVKWTEAQAILAFRLQHGNFQSIDQLQGIDVLTSEWIEKIRPYLTVE